MQVELWVEGYYPPIYCAKIVAGKEVKRFRGLSLSSYDRLWKWCSRRTDPVWVEKTQRDMFDGSHVFDLIESN